MLECLYTIILYFLYGLSIGTGLVITNGNLTSHFGDIRTQYPNSYGHVTAPLAFPTFDFCSGSAKEESVMGKIILIEQGNCDWRLQIKNAQLANATGIIIRLNQVICPVEINNPLPVIVVAWLVKSLILDLFKSASPNTTTFVTLNDTSMVISSEAYGYDCADEKEHDPQIMWFLTGAVLLPLSICVMLAAYPILFHKCRRSNVTNRVPLIQ